MLGVNKLATRIANSTDGMSELDPGIRNQYHRGKGLPSLLLRNHPTGHGTTDLEVTRNTLLHYGERTTISITGEEERRDHIGRVLHAANRRERATRIIGNGGIAALAMVGSFLGAHRAVVEINEGTPCRPVAGVSTEVSRAEERGMVASLQALEVRAGRRDDDQFRRRIPYFATTQERATMAALDQATTSGLTGLRRCELGGEDGVTGYVVSDTVRSNLANFSLVLEGIDKRTADVTVIPAEVADNLGK